MISIKLTLDERRAKKDNTYPIIFRITCDGISRDIKTGFSSKQVDWNNRTNNIKETHPSFSIIAPRLKELELTYLAKLIEFEKVHPNNFNVQQIKEYLVSSPQKTTTTVLSFWQREIQQLYKAGRDGGAQVYKEAMIAINKIKSLDVPFEHVDYNFITDVEVEFKSREVKTNTIGIHFRELRAIYNKAIKSKLVSRAHYPFADYKIKKEATTPRPITLEEMRNYFHLSLKKGSKLYENWLLGKLMFMLMGINFKDLILLSESNLKTNRVIYFRAKTKKMYNIKLLDEAQEIINYFKSKNSETLFGKITKADLAMNGRITIIIRQKNKNFNKHLNKLGKMIGSKEKLTGYVFRYTWANIAKQLGYSKDMIAEGLGHKYGNPVTGIYLADYDKDLIDEMNENILKRVLG